METLIYHYSTNFLLEATMIRKCHFILYVHDQETSTTFYTDVFGIQPRLHVPGMTEFDFSNQCVLGLMPEAGIKRLLKDTLPDFSTGTPRAEVYLLVDDPQAYHARALACGARELSPLQQRDWGHWAAYSYDLDGYVLAFAKEA
jgi:predicted enzyme related to lactoylglutathione lyase